MTYIYVGNAVMDIMTGSYIFIEWRGASM